MVGLGSARAASVVALVSLSTVGCLRPNPDYVGMTGDATSETNPTTSGGPTTTVATTTTDSGVTTMPTEGTTTTSSTTEDSGSSSSTGDIIIIACGGMQSVLCHAPSPSSVDLGGVGPGPIAAGPVQSTSQMYDDLAIGFMTSDEVQVVVANGTLFMEPQTPVAIGNGPPLDIDLFDLDGDGDLEVLTSNQAMTGSDFAVFENTGSATLGAAQLFGTGNRFHALVVAELSGDAFEDVAVAVREDDELHVYRGEGGLQFEEPAFLVENAMTHPEAVAVGDLDGMGGLDLVLAMEGDRILPFFGDGSGGFTEGDPLGGMVKYRAVRLADFDEDGNLDIIASNDDDEVQILFGNGDGTFMDPQSRVAGGDPRWITVGDVNLDNHLDFAVANQMDTSVDVFAGNGTGAFVRVRLEIGQSPHGVVFAEINGDQVPDIVATLPDGNSLAIFPSQADMQ